MDFMIGGFQSSGYGTSSDP